MDTRTHHLPTPRTSPPSNPTRNALLRLLPGIDPLRSGGFLGFLGVGHPPAESPRSGILILLVLVLVLALPTFDLAVAGADAAPDSASVADAGQYGTYHGDEQREWDWDSDSDSHAPDRDRGHTAVIPVPIPISGAGTSPGGTDGPLSPDADAHPGTHHPECHGLALTGPEADTESDYADSHGDAAEPPPESQDTADPDPDA